VKRVARIIGSLRGPGVTTTLSGFGAQAILIVSGVLVARLLPVDERGQLALMGLLPIIICQLGGLGIPLAVTYELARRPASAASMAAVLVRVMPLQVIVLVTLHVCLLVAFFHPDGGLVWTAALLTIPAVPALLCQQAGLAILQGQQRFTAFNVQRLLPVVAYAGVLVVVAAGGFGGLVACAVGWTGAWIMAGASTTRSALRSLHATEGDDAIEPREFFRFGRRAVLGAVFPVEAFQLDQLIVAVLFEPTAMGLYVVAVALTNLPRFVAQSVGMIAYPRIAAHLDPRLAKRDLWRYFAIAVALCVAIVAFLEVTVGWLIPWFFGARYAGAVPVARLLLIAALFQSARRVLADGARGLGHPCLGAVAEVSSWVVLVPAVVLLRADGLRGIAVAMALTYGISLVVLVFGIMLRPRLVSSARS